MATAAGKRMDVAEFLQWDDGTDTLYELVRGEPVARELQIETHGRVVARLLRHLGNRLLSPCVAICTAGIALPERNDAFYLADVAVTCALPEPERQAVLDPLLIVEVLTSSTVGHDRGTKLPDYRTIPSVREIVLVTVEERRVELWRRDGTRWLVEDLIGDAELRLETVDARLKLAAVYDNTGV